MTAFQSPSGAGKRFATLAATLAALSLSPSAGAWDMSIDVYDMGSNLYISDGYGGWNWTTRHLVVSTGSDSNGTIPHYPTHLDWDGGEWVGAGAEFDSVATLPSLAASTRAVWYIDDATTEMPRTASAYVQGILANGESMGSHFAYEFDLTLDPNSSVTLEFTDPDTFASLASNTGDVGVAFAGLKLYSTDLGVDAFGGANQPYFEHYEFLNTTGTAQLVEAYLPLLGYTFENQTGDFVDYHLRLEGYAMVFTTPVPEPEIYGMLLAGLGLIGMTVHRRRRFTAI
jgi:hypothetical protein